MQNATDLMLLTFLAISLLVHTNEADVKTAFLQRLYESATYFTGMSQAVFQPHVLV
jgi:hypothetical protein